MPHDQIGLGRAVAPCENGYVFPVVEDGFPPRLRPVEAIRDKTAAELDAIFAELARNAGAEAGADAGAPGPRPEGERHGGGRDVHHRGRAGPPTARRASAASEASEASTVPSTATSAASSQSTASSYRPAGRRRRLPWLASRRQPNRRDPRDGTGGGALASR